MCSTTVRLWGNWESRQWGLGVQWAASREPCLLLSRNPEPRAGQAVLDKQALVATGQ